MDFSIKLSLKGVTKRVPSQSSYLSLCQTVNDLFCLNNSIFSLYFTDEKNERNAIENETDYHLALEFALIQHITLKVIVKLQGNRSKQGEGQLCLSSFEDELYSNEEEKEEDETKYFQCYTCFRSFASTRSFKAHYGVCEKLFQRQTQKFDCNKMRLRGIARSNSIKMNTLIKLRAEKEEDKPTKACKVCSRLIKSQLYSLHLNKCKNQVKKGSPQAKPSVQNILLYEKMLLSNNFMNYMQRNAKEHNLTK